MDDRPVATSPTMRSGFAWNLGGAIVYNFSQWALILILARLSSPQVVGEFTYLMAISAPIFLAVGLNLRTLQVTDTARRYSLDDYFLLRSLSNATAIVMSLSLGLVLSVNGATFAALVFIAIAKTIEATSLSCYGFYALLGRFDLIAQSMIWRSLLGPLLFISAYSTGDALWAACAGLALAWLVVGVAFDRRHVSSLAVAERRPRHGMRSARRKNVVQMLRRSIPLGLDQGVSSYSINLPRYGIERSLGSSNLGVYAGQAYLAQIVTMITMAMTGVFVPRMAASFARGARRTFVHDLLRMCVAGLILTTLSIVGALLFGEWFLRVTLGAEYADGQLLVMLMVASGFITLQRVLSKGLEASHRFRSYLLVDVITLSAIALPLVPLLQTFGVLGAAIASTIGFAVGSSVMGIFLYTIVRSMPKLAETAVETEGG